MKKIESGDWFKLSCFLSLLLIVLLTVYGSQLPPMVLKTAENMLSMAISYSAGALNAKTSIRDIFFKSRNDFELISDDGIKQLLEGKQHFCLFRCSSEPDADGIKGDEKLIKSHDQLDWHQVYFKTDSDKLNCPVFLSRFADTKRRTIKNNLRTTQLGIRSYDEYYDILHDLNMLFKAKGIDYIADLSTTKSIFMVGILYLKEDETFPVFDKINLDNLRIHRLILNVSNPRSNPSFRNGTADELGKIILKKLMKLRPLCSDLHVDDVLTGWNQEKTDDLFNFFTIYK